MWSLALHCNWWLNNTWLSLFYAGDQKEQYVVLASCSSDLLLPLFHWMTWWCDHILSVPLTGTTNAHIWCGFPFLLSTYKQCEYGKHQQRPERSLEAVDWDSVKQSKFSCHCKVFWRALEIGSPDTWRLKTILPRLWRLVTETRSWMGISKKLYASACIDKVSSWNNSFCFALLSVWTSTAIKWSRHKLNKYA